MATGVDSFTQMQEANWYKTEGEKNCAKLQSTRGAATPVFVPTVTIWEWESRIAYLLIYFFYKIFL
jgi:hypothetical protein